MCVVEVHTAHTTGSDLTIELQVSSETAASRRKMDATRRNRKCCTSPQSGDLASGGWRPSVSMDTEQSRAEIAASIFINGSTL